MDPTAAPATPPAHTDPADEEIMTWRRDAAIWLGADEASAEQFGHSGGLLMNGIPVVVSPRSVHRDDWLAVASLDKPDGVADDRWHRALLAANGQTMLSADWAWGLADTGAALLTLGLPREVCDDSHQLSLQLYGLLAITESVRKSAAAAAPLATNGKDALQ